jgi:flagellar protein FlbD
MIKVTRLNGKQLYINAELIRSLEGTPDTVISLTDGTQIIALERPEILVQRVIDYQRQVREGNLANRAGED